MELDKTYTWRKYIKLLKRMYTEYWHFVACPDYKRRTCESNKNKSKSIASDDLFSPNSHPSKSTG